jgi:hypothetical protein
LLSDIINITIRNNRYHYQTSSTLLSDIIKTTILINIYIRHNQHYNHDTINITIRHNQHYYQA